MAERKRNFIDHLHPPLVRRHTLRPLTTMGLGIACLTCLGVLLITGFTLSIYYVADQATAYERILHITTTLRYGALVRNLHYIAANVLMILTLAHLGRVFFTAGYKGRRLNWLYGLGLLALVLLANFTGYILPWDQVSYWAARIGAELASYFPLLGTEIQNLIFGGTGVGNETLLRAFALHAGTIPLLLIILTSLHLWRIRKDGGLAAPAEADREKIPARPWLYRAEGAVALLTLAGLVLLALLLDAPLHERADPQHPPNPAKAPWYFVGLQEMVGYSAFWGGVAVPVIIGTLLVAAPFIDRTPSHGGQWFARERRHINFCFALVFLSQIAFIVIGQWFRGKNWVLHWPF
jgi:quinol-cytochrome oxidoreductase complex cytochrome b subunit